MSVKSGPHGQATSWHAPVLQFTAVLLRNLDKVLQKPYIANGNMVSVL